MLKEILGAFEKFESQATFHRPMLENIDVTQIRYITPSVIEGGLVVRDDSYQKLSVFRGVDIRVLYRQVKKEIEAITDVHGQRYVLSPAKLGEYVVLDLSNVDHIAAFDNKAGVLLINARGHVIDSEYNGDFEQHLKAIEPVLNKRRRNAAQYVSPSVPEKPSKVLIDGTVINLADVVSFRPAFVTKGIIINGENGMMFGSYTCDFEVEGPKLEAALNKYLGY